MPTITEKARAQGLAPAEYILRRISDQQAVSKIQRTLLAVCPNSEAVIKAAVRSAMRANAPILFAATLNQVDSDGGYTGMTQAQFVERIRREAESLNWSGPIVIGLDHGGPWLKDIQTVEKWELPRCMNWIKKSLEAAILAGYDLLHIDPTVDITLPKGRMIPIAVVADRTIELILHAEKFRREQGRLRIAYEVGTEEVHGGLADMATFRTFLRLLKEGLAKNQLADVWPCFIVGKVGTDLHTAYFDAAAARRLAGEAAAVNSVIKGHYTDNVANPQDYPLSGMGGANVGPEFTEAEYEGLMTLTELEGRLVRCGRMARESGFKEILEKAVIDSGRWVKWLFAEERDRDFPDLAAERQSWLVRTGCRYVWTVDDVLAARRRMYENLTGNGFQAEEIVLLHIERAMDKYFHKFNLINLNTFL